MNDEWLSTLSETADIPEYRKKMIAACLIADTLTWQSALDLADNIRAIAQAKFREGEDRDKDI